MANLKFNDLKNRLKRMMPDKPFPKLDLKSSDHPAFLEKSIKRKLEEELNKISNPENQ